jgi:hypothetical protein
VPQPPRVAAAAQRLIDLFVAAQLDIDTQLAGLTANQGRRRARLRQLQRSVDQTLTQLTGETQRWVETELPAVYALGGTSTERALGQRFVWGPSHLAAVQVLAQQSFDDLLQATRYVSESTKKWIRTEARRQTGLSLIEGRTAQQAARAFVTAASGELVDEFGPVGVVRYADGSYRRLADHADMLLRTLTANAFNQGSINQSKLFGVTHMECSDGTECGLTGHLDGEKPNGRVYPMSVAEQHPLSHPRCRRAWSPRVDVKTPEQAATAAPSTTEAQRVDQAQAERDRTDQLTRRRVNRRRREARAARRRR